MLLLETAAALPPLSSLACAMIVSKPRACTLLPMRPASQREQAQRVVVVAQSNGLPSAVVAVNCPRVPIRFAGSPLANVNLRPIFVGPAAIGQGMPAHSNFPA